MNSKDEQKIAVTAGDWIERAGCLTYNVRDFVEGKWMPSAGNEALKKFSPRNGAPMYELYSSREKDVENAVSSCRSAVQDGRWSSLSSDRRKEVLMRLAGLIEARREELALLECLDVGKPIRNALEFDIPAVATVIRYSAEAADKRYGAVHAANQSNLSYLMQRPVGVVASIVGWNFPALLAASKIGPALATGNCVVMKPSEITSLSTSRIAEMAMEAGVPNGVLNVVHGGAVVGAQLACHNDVDLVTFTGSTATGKRLLISAGMSNMKRLLLECGGKAADIVFEDSPDLDAVADSIVRHAFWNQGQVCTATSRVLVQSSIREELITLIAAKASEWRLGDPLNPDTTFGALVSREHKSKVSAYIEKGLGEGASLVFGSSSPEPVHGGFYMSPVVFGNVLPTHTIAREEIFGPVLSITAFEDEEDAIRIANGTIYGLSSVVWTKDLGRAQRLTQGIRAGWIVVNATERPTGGPADGGLPIGGHKQSGVGVEGGLDGLGAYTVATAVQLFY